MRPNGVRSLILVAYAACASAVVAAQSPEVLLEDAIYRETAAADLEGAVEAYQAVLKAPRVPPRVAARAHLRLGICFYWKGDSQLSRRHLEAVTASYSTEADLVRTARRYLGQPAMDDAASFLPEDILFYVELLEPRENIHGLSALVEGTPFQNPVDYYVSALARAGSNGAATAESSPAPEEPRQTFVREAAAFLNEGFLREMQLVESLALGVPGDGRLDGDFLAVLDPGASNILRGLVQMGLTISGAAPVGTVHDTAIFRLAPRRDDPGIAPDQRQHLAIGSGVVLLGRPQKLVEEAVDRGGGRIRSLADSEEFRMARAAGAGGIFFAYVGTARLVEAIRKTLHENECAPFDAFSKSLGVERFRSAGISLSRLVSADSLRLEVRARVDTAGYAAWEALAAPPLGGEVLRAIPSESLVYFATRFDGGSARVEAMYRAAAPLLELLKAEPGGGTLKGIESLHDFLRAEPARALLDAIDGLAVAIETIEPQRQPDAPPPLIIALELRSPETGGPIIEGALTAIFHEFFKNAASRAFQDETLSVDGTDLHTRYLEPTPGVKLRYVRLDRTFVLSLSETTLTDAARAHANGKNAAEDPPPAGTGKLVVVRPAAIVRASHAKLNLPPELELVLGEIDRIVLSTREEKDGVVLDVVVPGITPTTRSILNKVAEELAKKRAKP